MEFEKNENGHYRGLHIAIINPDDGTVESAKVFDTYATCTKLDLFIKWPPKDGRIMAVACKDECTTKLSNIAYWFFNNNGAKEMWNLNYRQGFAFIGIVGTQEGNESRAATTRDTASVT